MSGMENVKLGFIGGGNMADALIGGLLGVGVRPADIWVADPNVAQREKLEGRYGVNTCTQFSTDVVAHLDALILAVKPQQMRGALEPLAGAFKRQLVLSIAAGLPIAALSGWLGGHRHIVRAMPNTPALIRAGVTGLVADPAVDAGGRALAEQLMAAVGKVLWVKSEAQMDAVTAVSGSGPAYFFLFIEALQQAGESLGFSSEDARELAVCTALGAARLAEHSEESVSVLRERVTSKGGTTEAALLAMREHGVPEGIAAGVRAAEARGKALAASLTAGG